jgi:hypothetical protein
LVIIFVFDPLAISLVVAANFAFEKAYPKKKFEDNLYGEKEEVKERDNTLQDGLDEWDEDHALDTVLNDIVDEEEVMNALKDIEVRDAEEIKTSEEFIKEIDKIQKVKQQQLKKVRRIIQKGPSKWRVEFTDGTNGWVDRQDVKDNPNKITYM